METLPQHDRPRERLMRLGEDALSTVELLAIVLGCGTKNKSALTLAAELLATFDGIEGLKVASIEELIEVEGIGTAKAIQIKAALSLSQDLSPKKQIKNLPFSYHTSRELYEAIRGDFVGKNVEVLLLLCCNVRREVFHKEIIAVGTLTGLLLHPREIFYHVFKRKAHHFILAHNHPSGDPEPSPEDIQVSKILFQSSQLMGCLLKDHLILGSGGFVSLLERNVFN